MGLLAGLILVIIWNPLGLVIQWISTRNRLEDRALKQFKQALNDTTHFYTNLHSELISYIAKKHHKKIGSVDHNMLRTLFKKQPGVIAFMKMIENKRFAPGATSDESQMKADFLKARDMMKHIRRGGK